MKNRILLLIFVLCTSCYQRQDPLVRAVQDLQQMANQFATQEEEKIQQFNALRLGMSEDEVMKRLGAPSSRRTLSTAGDATAGNRTGRPRRSDRRQRAACAHVLTAEPTSQRRP